MELLRALLADFDWDFGEEKERIRPLTAADLWELGEECGILEPFSHFIKVRAALLLHGTCSCSYSDVTDSI